uniref:Uncharacterized protein n=1 Tax=Anguilla anguilla TaxID=7936 RepID=A0A0E9U0S1_ANGAN
MFFLFPPCSHICHATLRMGCNLEFCIVTAAAGGGLTF